ncbi:MAG: sugar nucleotide-binding protein [Chloroflexota bacterium]
MKILITGMNGTVAPVLAKTLISSGYAISSWNRSQVPIDDTAQIENFIATEQPDIFFHVATGPAEWAEKVAQVCAQQNIKFLFTSSVSVYSNTQQGPFSVDIEPVPNDDYGRYKLECERRVMGVNPSAWLVRLGWQIGTTMAGNHMVAHLEQAYQQDGSVEASTQWYPGCSFLEDTAAGIKAIVENQPAGVYHLGGNPGLTYFEIVTHLKETLERPWEVRPTTAFVYNNRLVDGRFQSNSISDRFN